MDGSALSRRYLQPRRHRDCGGCVSTTRVRTFRSLAPSTRRASSKFRFRFRHGWATPTSKPPYATYATRVADDSRLLSSAFRSDSRRHPLLVVPGALDEEHRAIGDRSANGHRPSDETARPRAGYSVLRLRPVQRGLLYEAAQVRRAKPRAHGVRRRQDRRRHVRLHRHA